jgi:hypothetical protein
MEKSIDLHLNEKREAEYFGDRFFFGIQAAGQLYLWSLNLRSGIFLGLGIAMLYQFVLSCRCYARMRAEGNRLLRFDERGLTHFAMSLHGPVFIPWESITGWESRKHLNIMALRLHLAGGKKGATSHGNRRHIDITSDLLGKSPKTFAADLASFARARHLSGITAANQAESTAQAA